jgi:hypothetical protein
MISRSRLTLDQITPSMHSCLNHLLHRQSGPCHVPRHSASGRNSWYSDALKSSIKATKQSNNGPSLVVHVDAYQYTPQTNLNRLTPSSISFAHHPFSMPPSHRASGPMLHHRPRHVACRTRWWATLISRWCLVGVVSIPHIHRWRRLFLCTTYTLHLVPAPPPSPARENPGVSMYHICPRIVPLITVLTCPMGMTTPSQSTGRSWLFSLMIQQRFCRQSLVGFEMTLW